jgi:8-oxo-dGTP pyrophosphatase MutT (NUDIX family)
MQLPVAIRRIGYRVAYRGLQVVWFVWRPEKNGVKCLVTDNDRVLLVRHTYGRRSWDLPGGAVKTGEQPIEAARREMEEELGLGAAPWTGVGQLRGSVDHRRDTIYLFRAEVGTPTLAVDAGEIAAAQWFARGRLPTDLSPYVSPVLAHTNALGDGGSA